MPRRAIGRRSDPSRPLRVFVAASDPSVVEAVLANPAYELAGHVQHVEHCLPIVGELDVDALVVADEGDDTVALARHLRLIYPRLALTLLVAADLSPSVAAGLERAGVNVVRELSSHFGEVAASALPGPAPPRTQADGAASPRRWLSGQRGQERPTPSILTQQVVAVCSPKGGVGKTLLATNLAVAVATRTPARTVLVDLDLASSDVGVHLDLLEGPTIVDLLPYLPEVGSADLRRFVMTHRASGLDVLLGPARPELAGLVKTEHLRRILDWLRREYHFVFLDTPPDTSSDLVCECLEAASRILLVTTTDAASLRQARVMVDVLDRLGTGKERVLLVVNQLHEGSPVTLREVQSFLGLSTVFGLVTDRRLAEGAVFEGKPLVLQPSDHPLVVSLLEVAAALCPGMQLPADGRLTRPRGVLGWLKRVLP